MGIDVSVLENIWKRILSELTLHQDLAPKKLFGQVVNPICGIVYALDTACAAKAFAAEYCRTKNEEWLNRANAAIVGIPVSNLCEGLHEIIWDVLGWHNESGSLAATGMALDAIWDAIDLLDLSLMDEDYELLMTFLVGCNHGKGKFAHNTVKPGHYSNDVQNTNAVALYLLEYITKKSSSHLKHPLFKEKKYIIRHLCEGQKKDGYWPYIHPGLHGKIIWTFPVFMKIPEIKRVFLNVDFGDIMHQAMTIYFFLKYIILSNNRKYIGIIARGWEWLEKHFINNHEKGLTINWDSEPVPAYPRYCNFRDTNTYFLILALLPNLVSCEIITNDKSVSIINSILRHINNNLLQIDGKIPCIIPHEGPPEILRNILPMFDQGVAWKGNFLADVVMKSF